MYYAAISGSLVHSEWPDCGCWNLIYGTCSALDGQSMRFGQEMDTQVRQTCFFLFWTCVYNVCSRVSLGVCLFSLSLSLCVYRQEQAKAPSSALSSPTSTPPLSQRASLSLCLLLYAPSRRHLFMLFCLHFCPGQPAQC